MSSIEKKITKLLKIAQNSSNEVAFQNDGDYLEFKSLKLKSLHSLEINRLICGLNILHFEEESIHWLKRLLKVTNLRKREDRYEIFNGIIRIYMIKEEHELVIKYCKEALENVKGTSLPRHILDFHMGNTLICLKKYREALPYFNSENLTYFTNLQINEHPLGNALCFYRDYIQCHMRNNRHFDVLETMGTITICKLNSEDPNDVKNECENILLNENENIEHGKYYFVPLIAEICLMKCQLLKALGAKS